MEKKIATKKASVKKTAAKPAGKSSPPYEGGVAAAASADGVVLSKGKTKPVKKAVRKSAKTAAIDPFAEIAAAEPVAKPVKKRATKSEPRAIATRSAKRKTVKPKKTTLDITAELAAAEPQVELSPVFKALADVKLPELGRENRARLQMQSPTQLYFYWSLKENPWHQLRHVFPNDLGSYALVVKLVDLTRDIEEIHPCDEQGNWWFRADAGREYQAEIGFYATNRPYFRILYSNTVATPLRSPSPHPAADARWTVSTTKFVEVLDAAGFSRDAFDVAVAGDDVKGADNAAHIAFSRFVGSGEYTLDSIAGGDIRYAMAALAGGAKLDELRWQIDERLFAILQANREKLTSASAQSAIDEYFDIDETEFDVEQTGPAVFGASLVHFPRTLRPRSRSRYSPLSSHSIR